MSNKAEIIIAAKDLAKRELDKVTKEVKGMSDKSSGHVQKLASKFANLATSAVKAAAKIAAIGAGVTFAALLVGLYALKKVMEDVMALAIVQETAEARLGVVLEATGHAAGYNLEQLKKMASEMQNVTTSGDEVILSGMSILATFKSISGDVFKRTTMAALDMSQVMGQDLKSSMVQLGKAINDPITGLSALSRVGVTFSEQQKDQIKNLVETNDLMEAQTLILEELESEFGGAAAKGISPYDKAVQQLKNTWGDLKEEIGYNITKNEYFINLIDKAKEKVQEWIPALEKWRAKHKEIIAQKFDEYLHKVIDKAQELWDKIKNFYESGQLEAWAERIKFVFGTMWKVLEKTIDLTAKFIDKAKSFSDSWTYGMRNVILPSGLQLQFMNIKEFTNDLATPIEIPVNFTGTGSSTLPLSEKITEMQNKVAAFSDYVSSLGTDYTINATGATQALSSALESVNATYESKLQSMISYIALSQTEMQDISRGSKPYMYTAYRTALKGQIEAAQRQIEDLVGQWQAEQKLTAKYYGGNTNVGGITVNVSQAQTAQDWRSIVRNYIIPEMQSAGVI